MRWIFRGLAVLAGLAVLFAIIVFAGSEWVLRRSHAVPEVAIAVPKDAASVAEGGRLAKIVGMLADEKVNIRALSVMDATEQSVLRLVVDDLESTRQILTSLGTEFTASEVLAVELENRPGAIARILERLASEHINIEYAYVSGASASGRSLAVFHTSNPKRALQILSEAPTNGQANAPGRRPLHVR